MMTTLVVGIVIITANIYLAFPIHKSTYRGIKSVTVPKMKVLLFILPMRKLSPKEVK